MNRLYSSIEAKYFELEKTFGAHNYNPLPVVLKRGLGPFLWDLNDKKYFDFLSAYSSVNQGHCHPEILKALFNQASKLTLTSRAFYNDTLGEFEEFVCTLFNYDKVLPMNSGVEAAESAIKLARKWGYEKKRVKKDKAKIIFPKNNFWGRSIAAISSSTNPIAYKNFGPLLYGFETVPYDNLNLLEIKLKSPDCVAFMLEPIQGEAGVIVPSEGYLSSVKYLCNKYNVLFIADEIQTGLGRTGKILATDYEDAKPDILVLGKALSGGIMPISAVLCNNEIMLCLQPGEHGSTFGGNPLSAKIAKKSLEVIIDEKLAKNAFELGKLFRSSLNDYISKSSTVKLIRGKGLLNGMVINDNSMENLAWKICIDLMKNGVLAKPTNKNVIRFAPPLVINKTQITEAITIIKSTLVKFENK